MEFSIINTEINSELCRFHGVQSEVFDACHDILLEATYLSRAKLSQKERVLAILPLDVCPS